MMVIVMNAASLKVGSPRMSTMDDTDLIILGILTLAKLIGKEDEYEAALETLAEKGEITANEMLRLRGCFNKELHDGMSR